MLQLSHKHAIYLADKPKRLNSRPLTWIPSILDDEAPLDSGNGNGTSSGLPVQCFDMEIRFKNRTACAFYKLSD